MYDILIIAYQYYYSKIHINNNILSVFKGDTLIVAYDNFL